MTWTFVAQVCVLASLAAIIVIAIASSFRAPSRPLRGDPGAQGPSGPPCQGACCSGYKSGGTR